MHDTTIQRHLSSSIRGRDNAPDHDLSNSDTYMGRETNAESWRQLESAYEEYCQRTSAGEDINASLFCNRFPACRSSLTRRLMIHELLSCNPGTFEKVFQAPWPEPGDRFLRFSLIEELGRGATSRVFLAEEMGLGSRRVVVKISHTAGYEAEILGKLSHPNIVPVHSVERDPSSNLTAICMPNLCSTTVHHLIDIAFVDGTPPVTLPSVTSRVGEDHRRFADSKVQSAFPAKRSSRNYVNGVLEIVRQLFDALAHTHKCGVLHLDLKPSNILITRDAHPYLLDFNLSADHTIECGLSGGTLPYMSPEQIQANLMDHGSAPVIVDEQSDIYSMGVILYQLLTGVHPFESVDWQQPTELVADELLERQTLPFQSPRRLNPNVDAPIERFIKDCLAFDSSDRPQSAAEAESLLQRHLSAHRRTARWSRGHRKSTAAIIVLFFAVLLGMGYGAYSWATQPSKFDLLLTAGQQEFETGNHQQAIAFLNEAVDLENKSAKARVARGRARLAVRNFSSAFEDFCEAERLSPDPMNLAYAAVCQQALADHSQARFYYNKAIHAGLQNAAIWNNLGVSYANSAKLPKEHDRADTCFKNALMFDPGFQSALLGRALNQYRFATTESQIEQKMHRLKLALFHVNEAIDVGPRTPELLLLAASCEGLLAVYTQEINKGSHTTASREAFANMLEYYNQAANRGVHLAAIVPLEQWRRVSPDDKSIKLLEDMVARNPLVVSVKSNPRVFDPGEHTPIHGI